MNSIDWSKKDGLLFCNVPCMPSSRLFFPFVDDQDIIRIPQTHILIPSFMLLLPCVWIHFCMICWCMKAEAIFIFEKDSAVRMECRSKNIVSETMVFQRKKVTVADIEYQKSFFVKQIRLSIADSSGGPHDKTLWVPESPDLLQSYKAIVDQINNRVQGLNLPQSHVPQQQFNNSNSGYAPQYMDRQVYDGPGAASNTNSNTYSAYPGHMQATDPHFQPVIHQQQYFVNQSPDPMLHPQMNAFPPGYSYPADPQIYPNSVGNHSLQPMSISNTPPNYSSNSYGQNPEYTPSYPHNIIAPAPIPQQNLAYRPY